MIKVTVWNEYLEELQYELVAKVYPNGIHECIREFLEKDPEIQVRCVTLRMEDQGLSEEILNETDVLIWWGHQAHDEVTEENVQRVKQHVLDGMGLIALHSAHYSSPMKELLGTSMCVRWKHGEREKLVCVAPSHPIAEGIIEPVILEREEMYGEYFDIPKPDDVVFLGWLFSRAGMTSAKSSAAAAPSPAATARSSISSRDMKNIRFIIIHRFRELLPMQ